MAGTERGVSAVEHLGFYTSAEQTANFAPMGAIRGVLTLVRFRPRRSRSRTRCCLGSCPHPLPGKGLHTLYRMSCWVSLVSRRSGTTWYWLDEEFASSGPNDS